MIQSDSSYDPVALKARLVQRHGSDLGTIVFDAEIIRRVRQDARAAELGTELTALHSEMDALLIVAAERRAKSKVRLEAAYSVYLALCDEAANADSLAQAEIAPLSARSLDIQEQMRNISQPRISELELLALARYALTPSERLPNLDREPPPPVAALSKLAQINMGIGLQRPRS